MAQQNEKNKAKSGRREDCCTGLERSKLLSSWMKPTSPCGNARQTSSEVSRGLRRFPLTDYGFQSGLGDWRGYSSPSGDDGSEFRNLRRLNRQFLAEAAREYGTEMAVFGLIVLASGWLVLYMVITVVTLLSRGHP